MESPLQFFAGLKDPRVERTKDHLLEDIIMITIAAVICGAESWYDIEEFGQQKEAWLKKFLKLPNGIPTHDTFNRFFAALEPKELGQCFLEWTQSVVRLTKGEVIGIDGKTLRGSYDQGSKSMVHMVSAWASTNNLVLAQQKVEDKSNEITAIPALLEVLALSGCIVTIDAMGCQKEIASAIVDKKADYILAVKGNQGQLHGQVQESFRFMNSSSVNQQTDLGHGRVEKRTCSVITDLSLIEQQQQWKGLQSLIRIQAERYIKATQETQQETRYYISSLKIDATPFNQNIRDHWKVENSLHWVLDVAFHEDQSQKRAGYAAQNFSVINRIALNLLKNDTHSKRSVKGKRLVAGWNTEYLQQVLGI
jgi:predicted transposase YbfD/YdcC